MNAEFDSTDAAWKIRAAAFCATNSASVVWATNVLSFTTLAPLSPPVLSVGGVTITTGGPSFSITAAAGVKYRLDYKPALTNTNWSYGNWITNLSGNAQSMTLTNPSKASQPQCFYRLEVAWP